MDSDAGYHWKQEKSSDDNVDHTFGDEYGMYLVDFSLLIIVIEYPYCAYSNMLYLLKSIIIWRYIL